MVTKVPRSLPQVQMSEFLHGQNLCSHIGCQRNLRESPGFSGLWSFHNSSGLDQIVPLPASHSCQWGLSTRELDRDLWYYRIRNLMIVLISADHLPVVNIHEQPYYDMLLDRKIDACAFLLFQLALLENILFAFN